MNFQIDKNSRVPLYTQLEEQIRFHIATGTLKDGQRLPSLRGLAETLSVNLHTIAKAYENLQEQGLIEMLGPKGTFVSMRTEKELIKPNTPDPLTNIADNAIQEAMRLGYSLRDLMRVITDRIATLERTQNAHKIAFVECSDIEAIEYSEYIQNKLEINVVPIELAQLERNPDILGNVALVVTTFFHFGKVKSLLNDVCEVIGVVIKPQIDGLQQLANLPQVKHIGVLCRDEETIPTLVSVVQGIYPDNVKISSSIIGDEDAMVKMLSEVDAITYTPPCRDVVKKTAPPNLPLIEHKAQIDAESLGMLHRRVNDLRK